MDAATKYVTVLQERFPNVTVRWETPPDRIFENHACTLIFSPKSDPETVYPVEFPKGLGYGTFEDNISALLAIHGEQIDSF